MTTPSERVSKSSPGSSESASTRSNVTLPDTAAMMPVVSQASPPNPEAIRRAPKVLLHDHLDGGLRPRTIVELAELDGYRRTPDP